jgi:hypothetical protein
VQDDASAGAVRVRGVSLIFLTAVLAAGPARAEISVTVARIAEGYLWVIGQAAEPEVEIRLTGLTKRPSFGIRTAWFISAPSSDADRSPPRRDRDDGWP